MKHNYMYLKSILVENINIHKMYIGPSRLEINIDTPFYIIIMFTIFYALIGAWKYRDMYSMSHELEYTSESDDTENERDDPPKNNDATNDPVNNYISIHEILAFSLET